MLPPKYQPLLPVFASGGVDETQPRAGCGGGAGASDVKTLAFWRLLMLERKFDVYKAINGADEEEFTQGGGGSGGNRSWQRFAHVFQFTQIIFPSVLSRAERDLSVVGSTPPRIYSRGRQFLDRDFLGPSLPDFYCTVLW